MRKICLWTLGYYFTIHSHILKFQSQANDSSYCCCSVARSCPTLCKPMDCSKPGFPVLHYPGFPVLHYLPEFAQTHVPWVGDDIQPSHPLPLPSPFAFSLSQDQGLFQWVHSSSQVAKVLELQLPHQSFQWIFRVDFFRIDWFDLPAVQGTLKSLLQHYNSKSSILRHSAFFMVQLLYPYMTIGKTIALTILTFLAKWYLCFLVLCLGLSAFLPRSKCL